MTFNADFYIKYTKWGTMTFEAESHQAAANYIQYLNMNEAPVIWNEELIPDEEVTFWDYQEIPA